MHFSNRLNSLPPHFFSSLVKNVEDAIAEGRDVINLGRGNPDKPTPPHIVKALQEAVEDPLTHGYAPFRGTTELKEAAAQFYKREYGVEIDPETEVAVLFGSKTGLVSATCDYEPRGTLATPRSRLSRLSIRCQFSGY